MIRRPPRSTLFPYTTALPISIYYNPLLGIGPGGYFQPQTVSGPSVSYYGPQLALVRSEEHTSELQSQSNIVCRLLLEIKTPSHSPHTPAMPPAHSHTPPPHRY